MKRIVTVALVATMMAFGIGISSLHAQQQSQQPQGRVMPMGMMVCPMMNQVAQSSTRQGGTMMTPMMHRGCMMMNGMQAAPQPQTPPPAVPSN